MKSEIKQWLADFSGCNGGNIGSKDNPSIWVCGLEYNEDWSADDLQYNIYQEKWENTPNFGMAELQWNNHHYPIYKLLDFIAGSDDYQTYQAFAENKQIFVQDSKSPYYKMNLYPIGFPKHDDAWKTQYNDILELNSRDEYIGACKQHRFPAMKQWVQDYAPKMIICLGRTSKAYFDMAFGDNDDEFFEFQLDGQGISYKKNNNGTIIVVLPFLTYTSNNTLWVYGVFLRGLLK